MRTATTLGFLILFATFCAVNAGDSAKQKAKPSLQDDAKSLQGAWDRPPMKAADGKLTHGLRLEFRNRQLTISVYAKAGDPKGGDNFRIERPFVLKEDGGKRFIESIAEDVPVCTYILEGDRLTVTSESFLITKIGKDWYVPDKNMLSKMPDKK